MFGNYCPHIWQAPVTNFEGVSVKNGVEKATPWELLVN